MQTKINVLTILPRSALLYIWYAHCLLWCSIDYWFCIVV